MKNEKILAVIYAIAAALFYALNVPFSKLLMTNVSPTFMAGFLYLGAGIGVGIMYLFHFKKEEPASRLSKKDMPYTIGMVLLDILAPILLMIGVSIGTSSNASLLGNFEIVATSLIALFIFKENVSKRLWFAVALITAASLLLSFDADSVTFSIGSIFVIGATVCWGFENNCTRNISNKSTYQIVTIKGMFSGLGALIIAMVINEQLPDLKYIFMTLCLGFVAYGLSIFTYIRAQKTLGAAKTSAYYAIAPFLGVLLSFVLFAEPLALNFLTALTVMILGTAVIICDTLTCSHKHLHRHILIHTHDGKIHTHTITHSHKHNHIKQNNKHIHIHSSAELKKYLYE